MLIGLVLVSTFWVGPVGATGHADSNIRIVTVYPQSPANGDAGEFIVVETDGPVNTSGWRLTDGRYTARLPNRTLSGRVALSTTPAVTATMTELPVVPLHGYLPLGDTGNTVTLLDGAGERIDRVTYPPTDPGVAWNRTPRGLERHIRFDRDWEFPARHQVPVAAFVLPDVAELPVATLRNATRRLLLAGYQLSDPRVLTALRGAVERGVRVTVLVDGSPVSGQSVRERHTLDSLRSMGVDVRVREGVRDPHRFHHPKYAIVDDTAILLTENWKPAGTGGASSRGWGIRVRHAAFADDLATVFAADAHGPGSLAWTRFRDRTQPIHAERANGSYPSTRGSLRTFAAEARLLVGPAMIEHRQRTAIANATESIRIIQVSIGDRAFPLLTEAVAAARSGVTVRILLDGSWYVADRNGALADELNAVAAREGLPLEARLVTPGQAFRKIHAKGVVVDEQIAILGSANWNNVSMRENREVAVLVRDPTVAEYYAESFDADWRDPTRTVPVGVTFLAVAAWAGAGTVGWRRIAFRS